jgi:hypothetical protein
VAAQTFLGRVQSQLRLYYGSQRHPLTLLDPTLETGGVPRDYVFTYSNCSWGTSAAALALVAQEFGYTLIARVVGLDLFFLRDDLIAGKPVRNWTQIFDGLATPTKTQRGQLKTSDPAILKRLVDYDVYRKTGSVKVAVAAGGALLKKHFRHAVCWQSIFHQRSSTSAPLVTWAVRPPISRYWSALERI